MLTPEVLTHLPELSQEFSGFINPAVSILLVFAMAFSQKQKNWILERDGHKCQATVKHECNEDRYPLEIDHIICQFYASLFGIDPDYPENALTKCREAHDIKHPDRVSIRKRYYTLKAQGIDAFRETLRDERREKVEHHLIYWNDKNDRTDTVRSVQLTQQFKRSGAEPFPEKHTRKKSEPIKISPMPATGDD